MKTALIYSSVTGNTKSLAEEIFKETGSKADIFKIENFDTSTIDDYDFIILGFWVDRGYPDKKMIKLMAKIEGKNLAYFLTLGAYPDSDHAKKVIERTDVLLQANRNRIFGNFICQGRLARSLEEKFKKFPKGHPHEMTAERIARHKEASKHPNEEDFKNGRETFNKIISKYKREVKQ